jgi:uncharacterized protein
MEPTPNECNKAALLHLSSFAGWLIPYIGLALPIIIWFVYKKESEFIDKQGYVFLNAFISYTIYGIACGLLCFILIGIPLLIVLAVITVWGTIRAALAARDGGIKEYPLAIRFLTYNTPSR